MTNEEAIEVIEQDIPCEYDTDLIEALEMAIAALKAQPCEDAVSREAAKKLYCNICMDNNICYRSKENCEELSLFDKLPLVTPKQRWIPVDYDSYPETYPKAFQEVWITDAYGEVFHKAYDGTRSIKAWMPYDSPEPYEEGESE